MTFFEDDKAEPEVFHGPNLKGVGKMTRREFTQGIMNVYEQLGGDAWLLEQAQADPKSFLDFLKKLIPAKIDMDDMAGISIMLVNKYDNGDVVEIPAETSQAPQGNLGRAEPSRGKALAPPASSPTTTSGPLDPEGPAISLIERYDDQIDTGNSLNDDDIDFI